MRALSTPAAGGAAPNSAETFYQGAYARMNWAMLVAGACAAPMLVAGLGASFGGGYLLGAGVAFLNLYWLRRLAERFADFAITASSTDSGIARAPEKPRTKRVVAIFILRYALIALGAYAIFLSSPAMLYGFFSGLVLPVIGVFYEAAAEIAYGFYRRER